MSIKLNILSNDDLRAIDTLNDSQLCEIFEAAEESDVCDSLYLRCRDELCDVTCDETDLHNAALALSWEKWEAMDKHEKIFFLRDVHSTWLIDHDFE